MVISINIKNAINQILERGTLKCFSCGEVLSYSDITGFEIEQNRIFYHCECDNSGYRSLGSIGFTGLIEFDSFSDLNLGFPIMSRGSDLRKSSRGTEKQIDEQMNDASSEI